MQAENAPSVYLSWKSRRLNSTETAETIADDLAMKQAFEFTMSMLRELVDFVQVSEEEIREAIRLYIEKAHTMAEGVDAAPLTAAYKIRDRLKEEGGPDPQRRQHHSGCADMHPIKRLVIK